MLSKDEYYELLLREDPDSDNVKAEYIRQQFGGGWHMSDKQIMKEIELYKERVINSPRLYKNMLFDDLGEVFALSQDELYKGLGVTPPHRPKYYTEEELDEIWERIHDSENSIKPQISRKEIEEFYENRYFNEADDNLNWLKKNKLEIALEEERIGSEKYWKIAAIKNKISNNLFNMTEEINKLIICVKFI